MGIENRLGKKIRNAVCLGSSLLVLSSSVGCIEAVKVKPMSYYEDKVCLVIENSPKTEPYLFVIKDYESILKNSGYSINPLNRTCEVTRWIYEHKSDAEGIYELSMIKYNKNHPDSQIDLSFDQFYSRNEANIKNIEKRIEQARNRDIEKQNIQKGIHDAAGRAGGIFAR